MLSLWLRMLGALSLYTAYFILQFSSCVPVTQFPKHRTIPDKNSVCCKTEYQENFLDVTASVERRKIAPGILTRCLPDEATRARFSGLGRICQNYDLWCNCLADSVPLTVGDWSWDLGETSFEHKSSSHGNIFPIIHTNCKGNKVICVNNFHRVVANENKACRPMISI